MNLSSLYILPNSKLSTSAVQVRNELRKIKARRAAGPDCISSRLIKSCADKLCKRDEHLFNISPMLASMPDCGLLCEAENGPLLPSGGPVSVCNQQESISAHRPLHTGEHPGHGHKDGDILQVSGSSPEQQAGLDWLDDSLHNHLHLVLLNSFRSPDGLFRSESKCSPGGATTTLAYQMWAYCLF